MFHPWASSAEVTLTGKVGNPPKPVGFTASENVVFGIELNWVSRRTPMTR
jgi:hypothetical protein